MFVSNKREMTPLSIEHNGVKIEIVSQFKLLGVTIDSKLSFNEYVWLMAKSINAKLFAIKKLFYLSFDVKILFFKTFILPYFDYCLSLIFYFSKTAISKLTRSYYFCLYRLFKFKINDDVIKTNQFLKSFCLFSFEFRIIYKLANFAFFIKNQSLAPSQLKILLIPVESNHDYNLRLSTKSILKSSINPKSKYGEWSFSGFYTKFFNNIKLNREIFSFNNIIHFKQFLLNNIANIYVNFIKIFSKFEINLNLNHMYF